MSEIKAVVLTQEQKALVNLCFAGKIFFFTGNAGTGKTKALQHIFSKLEGTYGREQIGRTATTGLAATALGGQTVHPWAGIGIGRGSRYQLLQRVRADKEAVTHPYCVKMVDGRFSHVAFHSTIDLSCRPI